MGLLFYLKPNIINPQLLSLITAGGDERLDIHPKTGRNKYHISMMDFDSLLSRGSCTANSLNPDSKEAIERGWSSLKFDGYDAIKSRQLERVFRLLSRGYHNDFDIFFAPSGSDLAYVPFLIAQVLHGSRDITTLTSCPEELGSGTSLAAEGKYFYTKNAVSGHVVKGNPVFRDLNINALSFPARSSSGEIIDQKEYIRTALRRNSSRVNICNLVVGSKSGIEDNLSIIPDTPEEVIWTVDLCQLRNSVQLIHWLLDNNCMVMLTGSKFYQAPPFCGMMLIPKGISEQISAYRGTLDPGFHSIFSQNDLPLTWSYLRSQFKPYQNTGLLLRWEAAIQEMERFESTDYHIRNKIIDDWNTHVSEQIDHHPKFELMPNQDKTNSSIISFRVQDKLGSFLSYDELKRLHFKCLHHSTNRFQGPYDHFTIGQPVKYIQGAFIRLALGSYDIRQLIQNPSFSNDSAIIDIIAQESQTITHD